MIRFSLAGSVQIYLLLLKEAKMLSHTNTCQQKSACSMAKQLPRLIWNQLTTLSHTHLYKRKSLYILHNYTTKKRTMATDVGADSIATVAEKAPVTVERRVRTDLDDRLPKPCSYTLSLSILFFFPVFVYIYTFYVSKIIHIYDFLPNLSLFQDFLKVD